MFRIDLELDIYSGATMLMYIYIYIRTLYYMIYAYIRHYMMCCVLIVVLILYDFMYVFHVFVVD